MSLSIDDELTLVEALAMLLGIAITWAVFYGSERAELPGEAPIPNPSNVEDLHQFRPGRSLK
jgi:hypothetical protein